MWPWKVLKWPWFWSKVAVKIWRDLARLCVVGLVCGVVQKWRLGAVL
jgi:hypothetical protein